MKLERMKLEISSQSWKLLDNLTLLENFPTSIGTCQLWWKLFNYRLSNSKLSNFSFFQCIPSRDWSWGKINRKFECEQLSNFNEKLRTSFFRTSYWTSPKYWTVLISQNTLFPKWLSNFTCKSKKFTSNPPIFLKFSFVIIFYLF